MHLNGVHHTVLLVDDVPEAESFYRELFNLDVLFREAGVDDEPGTLPEDISWSEAIHEGVTPYMSFLGRDEFYLAVAEQADVQSTERLDHIALDVDDEAFEAITEQAESLECDIEKNAPHHRVLVDRYDIEWELNAQPRPPNKAFEELDI